MAYLKRHKLYTMGFLLVAFIISNTEFAQAQANYWQQEVDYKIEVKLDVESHKFDGSQTIHYTNNSPDELKEIFIHLYLNAFQPNSMMDERSRSILDPDSRVKDRIFNLSKDEQGLQHVSSIKLDGLEVEYEVKQTILKANLPKPIKAGETVTFNIE